MTSSNTHLKTKSSILNRAVSAAAQATAGAAFGYAAAVVILLLTGGQLPLADPAMAAADPLNGPRGDIMTYLLPASAVVGGVLAAMVHSTRRPHRTLAAAATAFAAGYAAVVLLLIVDTKILALAGYIPFLAFKAVLDPGSLENMNVQWAVIGHQMVLIAGIALWVLTAATALRKSNGACLSCGRKDDDGSGWLTAAGASRWGPQVTVAAAVIPAAYALVRFAWAVGIPLGIEVGFLETIHETGAHYAALGLASMALLGSVLTLGLIQQWGSRFPRWIPGLGGRNVPMLLAVVPAIFVSLIVVPAGAELVGTAVSGNTGAIPFNWDNWATLAPTFLWPAWGPLLAAAALAYYLKRRGSCSSCGRDN